MGKKTTGHGRSATDLWKIASDRLARENRELYDYYVEDIEGRLKQKIAGRSLTSKKGLAMMRDQLLRKAGEAQSKQQSDTLRSICVHLAQLKNLVSTAASACLPAALAVGGVFVLVLVGLNAAPYSSDIDTHQQFGDEYFSEKDAEREMIMKMANFSHRHFVSLRFFKDTKVARLQAAEDVEQRRILLDRLWEKMCDFHTDVLRNQAYLAKYTEKGFKRGLQRFFAKKWSTRLESLVKADREIDADLETIDRAVNLDNNALIRQLIQELKATKDGKAKTPTDANLLLEKQVDAAVMKAVMQLNPQSTVADKDPDGELALIKKALALRSDWKKEGRTILHIAAVHGKSSLIETALLLDGTSANHQTAKYGWTALHLAAKGGHLTFVEALLDREDVDLQAATRTKGLAALHVAARAGKVKIIKLLLKEGAPIDQQDERGWTALHWAAYWGKPSSCRVLVKKEAEVDAKSHQGETPLHLAVKKSSNEKTVKCLLELGASRSIKATNGPREGQTAKRIAKELGHSDIVKLFSKNAVS